MDKQQQEQRKRNWSALAFRFFFVMDSGDRFECSSRVSDAIAWERNHGGTSFMAERPSVADLVWLGWAAAKRDGKTQDDFQLFASHVEDFSAVERVWGDDGDEVLPDPTPAEPSRD